MSLFTQRNDVKSYVVSCLHVSMTTCGRNAEGISLSGEMGLAPWRRCTESREGEYESREGIHSVKSSGGCLKGGNVQRVGEQLEG